MHLRTRRSWSAMTTLSWIVSSYAIVLFFVPQVRPPFLHGRSGLPALAVALHLGGGGIALGVGAFQLNAALRSRHIRLHRIMGRTYVISVFIGGLSGLQMAFASQGGMIAHAGFGLLACAWLFTTLRGFLLIRAGNDIDHRAWMIRSYAVTFAAVTLRIYLPLSLAFGLSFETAYPMIAWLCWLPNIIVAERFIVRKPTHVEVAS